MALRMDVGSPEAPNQDATPSTTWWREIQLLWLLLLVLGIYFSRISDLNLLGEETRRAQVAREMLWTGNWLVPQQQGKIYLSRPPLGSWAIAIAASIRGEIDTVAVRLPTLLAILLTTFLIYGYSRNFLSRTGAFLAAVAYPTMAQVLQLGRMAETEGLFTLLISASLMVWHWGDLKRWPAAVYWSAGYVLAALAGLTKGPQGIAYFVGPVWGYVVLVERRPLQLLRVPHLAGLMAGLATIAAWQVPYTLATSWEAGKAVWFTQASNRFEYSQLSSTLYHLVAFPIEILICTFPWSFALVQLANKKFWPTIKTIRSEVWFLLVALAVTFPTVWFAPFARGRYYMPLYPIMAVVFGLILERCAEAKPKSWMNRGWHCFIGCHAAVGVVGGVAVCLFAFWPNLIDNRVTLSPFLSIGFLIWAIALTGWMVFHYRSQHARDIQAAAAGLAVLLGLTYTGLIVSSQSERQPPVAALMAEVQSQLPPDAKLISYGRVSHAFTYYYPEFVPQKPWPDKADETLPTYFCFRKTDLNDHALPFAWEEIAELSFEDDDNPSPRSYVIVARRLPTLASQPETNTRH